MEFTIQKASIWKRLSAFILDAIIVIILATGISFAMTAITNYDHYTEIYTQKLENYQTQYNVEFDKVSNEDEYMALDPEYKARYDEAYKALIDDSEAIYCYNMMVNLTFITASVSILSSFLLAEFVLPLVFKDGQTVGKKVFGLAVIKNNGVKVTHVQMFVRSILAKCTVETMVPIAILIMLFFNMAGILALIVLIAFAILQIVLLIATKNNCFVHDIFAYTCVVDKASQKIFANEQELLEYQKEQAKLEVEKKGY